MSIYYRDDVPLPRAEWLAGVWHIGTAVEPALVLVSPSEPERSVAVVFLLCAAAELPMLRLCLAYAEMILDAETQGRTL